MKTRHEPQRSVGYRRFRRERHSNRFHAGRSCAPVLEEGVVGQHLQPNLTSRSLRATSPLQASILRWMGGWWRLVSSGNKQTRSKWSSVDLGVPVAVRGCLSASRSVRVGSFASTGM